MQLQPYYAASVATAVTPASGISTRIIHLHSPQRRDNVETSDDTDRNKTQSSLKLSDIHNYLKKLGALACALY